MSSVRRQINIAAPIRSVWKMITTPEGWTAWYADEARVDARSGGRVTLLSEGDDGPVEEVGMLHIYRPTSHLEIRWDSRSPASTRGTHLAFHLARDGEETRVSLVHSGGLLDEDASARQAIDDTWRRALAAMRDALESGR